MNTASASAADAYPTSSSPDWPVLLPFRRLLTKADKHIVPFHIPPYTPEMNPIEQTWKEILERGFRNEIFTTLEKVVDRLCDTIRALSNQAISGITGRQWIIEPVNYKLV